MSHRRLPAIPLSNPRLRSLAARTALFRNTAAAVQAAVASPAAVAPTAADMATVMAELAKAVTAFQAINDRHLAEQARGRDDAVTREQVARNGQEVVALQQLMETMSQQVAALRVGGVGGTVVNVDVASHTKAFEAWFRRGSLPPGGADALHELEVKATLQTDSLPDGGFIVPTTVETEITRVLGTVSRIRELARVINITTGNYKKAHNLGGATSGWVGETESRPNTNTPTLAELDFPVMEIYAQPAASVGILADAGLDLANWLAEEVAITFAEQEGAAFWNGNGIKRPRGIAAYDMIANASWEWGKTGFLVSGVAAALTDGTHNGIDVLKELSIKALKSGYTPNARWLMNRSTLFEISKIKDDNGQYLWRASNEEGVASQLLGYPVSIDDNVDNIGAGAFPVAFGDFRRGYVVIDRQGIVVLRDPFTSKPYVLFYTTKRVGGGIQDFDAIKFLKISA